jgi:hypothetical protein
MPETPAVVLVIVVVLFVPISATRVLLLSRSKLVRNLHVQLCHSCSVSSTQMAVVGRLMGVGQTGRMVGVAVSSRMHTPNNTVCCRIWQGDFFPACVQAMSPTPTPAACKDVPIPAYPPANAPVVGPLSEWPDDMRYG